MKIMEKIYQMARGVVCRILGFFWAMYIVIGFKFDFQAIECALDQEEILARREAWELKQDK
jgi:hypothetical protein